MGLFCDKEAARVAVQSTFPIGSFVGLIIINLFSVTKGRKVALQSTLIISVLGVFSKFCVNVVTIQGGLSGSILSLIIAQFMLGFGSYSILPLGYTILYDFFSDSFRPIAVIIVNAVG